MKRYFVNGGGNTDLTQCVLNLISGAKEYIKTGNFLFQDESVIDALNEKLESGLPLFIISNLREPEENSGKRSRASEEISVDMNLPYLNLLRENGAHCHFLDELHAKFIIVDGESALLMSANYTENSLGKNIETGILLNPPEIEELEYVFDKLYTNADVQNFEVEGERKHVRRKTKLISEDAFDSLSSNIRLTISSPETKWKKTQTNLSSCHVTSIYDSIIDIINESEEFVIIVSWHFRDLDKLPEFMTAVKNARTRGVRICLYSNCKGMSASLEMSLEAIKILEAMGCENFGDDNNHSKCVISEKDGIIFTANIDGMHGMTTGFEVGCMLDREQYLDVLNHAISLVQKKQ